jgi:hypothetical protein
MLPSPSSDPLRVGQIVDGIRGVIPIAGIGIVVTATLLVGLTAYIATRGRHTRWRPATARPAPAELPPTEPVDAYSAPPVEFAQRVSLRLVIDERRAEAEAEAAASGRRRAQ